MQSFAHLARSQASSRVTRLFAPTGHHASRTSVVSQRFKSDDTATPKETTEADLRGYYYPNTDVGIKERSIKGEPVDPIQRPYPPFPDGKNPKTGEVGGPVGPEPTRFGDWERKGRVTDF